jgi:hypothetical protein
VQPGTRWQFLEERATSLPGFRIEKGIKAQSALILHPFQCGNWVREKQPQISNRKFWRGHALGDSATAHASFWAALTAIATETQALASFGSGPFLPWPNADDLQAIQRDAADATGRTVGKGPKNKEIRKSLDNDFRAG